MSNVSTTLRTFALFAFTLLFASGAEAQATRTWVSGTGTDASFCSRSRPCKTLAGAISRTAMGGEITVLDGAGLGTVTITKSITIDGSRVPASILAELGNGITIDIPFTPLHKGKDPGIVRIRGLSINGAGTGDNGINVVSANKVSVEDSVIDGFTHHGINVSFGTLFVRNTTIRNNDGAGINVTGNSSQAAITDTSLVFNGTGLVGSVVKYCCVVLFGNRNGDPPPP